ncbi:MAG: 4Fe-4S dicluster domain-containing protein, partial [Gemmatimonadetes bacterium]|nr:4Fe-4S dicluster domain-containing protein [Gemmatimonadota bacterium]
MTRWGMVIDTDRCTGCGACVVACHAENNIQTVGEEEAKNGRAMHWLRIERHYEGEFPDIRVRFLPVLCQQCGSAPCEPVCPVYATYRTPEGLNAMVYSRCIGTRYCA